MRETVADQAIETDALLGCSYDQFAVQGGRYADIELAGICAFAETFHTELATLTRRLPVLFDRTSTASMVWLCWPKKAAQKALGLVSDLDDNVVRTLGLELGFVDVKVAAIDEVWSGLKFVRRLVDRPR